MFRRIEITAEDLELAKKWSNFKGNKHSIRTDNTKMIASNLAEICFAKQYPNAIRISDNDYNADFIVREKRIDVKCKERSVFCEDWYEVSVEARQIEYNTDWYVFYSYNSKEQIMEYLGGIEKVEYVKRARLYKKGDVMDNNKWKVSVDCYNLKISDLIK